MRSSVLNESSVESVSRSENWTRRAALPRFSTVALTVQAVCRSLLRWTDERASSTANADQSTESLICHGALQHCDRLDLDEPVGMRERAHFDQRRRGRVAREELLAHGNEVGAVADVGDVGVRLDDVAHGAALRLDERLDAAERLTRLRLEVARVEHAALLVVGHLPRQEQDRRRILHADPLRVRRGLEHALRAETLDRRHVVSSYRFASPAKPAMSRFTPLSGNATVTSSSSLRRALDTTMPSPNEGCRTWSPARNRVSLAISRPAAAFTCAGVGSARPPQPRGRSAIDCARRARRRSS